MAVEEERSPLLEEEDGDRTPKEGGVLEQVEKKDVVKDQPAAPTIALAPRSGAGLTLEGLPLGHVTVLGEPVGRREWGSGLFSCLGRNDEFCSSDLEVCLLGSVAPCVLYGGNAERLGPHPGAFTHHCLTYSGLYMLGNSLFGWNCLAPWFSYATRSTIRRQFNLQGNFETLAETCGCCGGIVEDDLQREQCEAACDFATHFFCHVCSLCQEGRELRRRVPHPGFNGRPMVVMLPPGEQKMARGNF